MNKFRMSLIIIFITIITSGYLFYDYYAFNSYTNNLAEAEAEFTEDFIKDEALTEKDEAVENDSNTGEEQPKDNLKDNLKDDINKNNNRINDSSNIVSEDKTQIITPIRKSEDIEKIIQEEETAEVFKMDKTKISGEISLKDKTRLLKIVGKLSMMDYGYIVEIMRGSDELGGATKIFNILKERLSEEDYQEVKDILSPYVYIDNIEENIQESN